MHTEGHDLGRDAADSSTPGSQFEADNPGYELTDVNVGGVVVFLAGLAGFLIVFFLFCYVMGRKINDLWVKEDGPPTKWVQETGVVPPGKGKNLSSNTEIEQKQLAQMVGQFPQPRLDVDDGNQAIADLHAKEDLLLEHTSSVDGQPGTIRIPIERAMQLIAQRGLPVTTQAAPGQSLAEAAKPEVQAPLTTGFARTGYELTTIEAREQKMSTGKEEAPTHAELTPVK